MGAILCLFQKKSSREELDEIEEAIKSIYEYNRNVENFHKTALRLLSYSASALFLLGLVYLYFFPARTWREITIFSGTLLTLALIGIFTRQILSWYYQFRKRRNNKRLRDADDKKKLILKNVMEKETYTVAKTILEKYAPATLLQERPQMSGALVTSPNQLRQRTNSPMTAAAAQRMIPPNGQRPYVTTVATPAASRSSGVLDKVAEMLVGDGTQNRYALICSTCHTHNGLALPEEFEYMSFRCLSCKAFNSARKHRPSPPKLSAPRPRTEPQLAALQEPKEEVKEEETAVAEEEKEEQKEEEENLTGEEKETENGEL